MTTAKLLDKPRQLNNPLSVLNLTARSREKAYTAADIAKKYREVTNRNIERIMLILNEDGRISNLYGTYDDFSLQLFQKTFDTKYGYINIRNMGDGEYVAAKSSNFPCDIDKVLENANEIIEKIAQKKQTKTNNSNITISDAKFPPVYKKVVRKPNEKTFEKILEEVKDLESKVKQDPKSVYDCTRTLITAFFDRYKVDSKTDTNSLVLLNDGSVLDGLNNIISTSEQIKDKTYIRINSDCTVAFLEDLLDNSKGNQYEYIFKIIADRFKEYINKNNNRIAEIYNNKKSTNHSINSYRGAINK